MDTYREIFKDNAIVIAVIIILVMLSFLMLGAFGIPFLNSPETYDAEDVVEFSETDDKVIVSVKNQAAKSQTVVKAGGKTYEWNNNKVEVSKENAQNLRIETYSQNELYDELDYTYNEHNFRIVVPDNVLTSKEVTLRALSDKGQISDVNWRVDGNVIGVSSPAITHKFEENREYNISAETQIDSKIYRSSKVVNAKNPDEIILDLRAQSENEEDLDRLTQRTVGETSNESNTNETNTNETNTNETNTNETTIAEELGRDKINVKVYEEIEFNTFELTNQNIDSLEYDFGDGTVDRNIEIGSKVLKWYEEPGIYNVTVTGDSSLTGTSGTDTIMVNVSSREEPVETRTLGVSVFEDGRGVIPDINVTINDGLIQKQTNQDGQVEFELRAYNNYTLSINESDYEQFNDTISINNDNIVKDIRLSERDNTEVNNTNETTAEEDAGLNVRESEEWVNNTNDSEGVRGDIELPELNNLLEDMSGNGTQADPYIITNVTELQAIRADTSGTYKLGDNIDAISTRSINKVSSVEDEYIGNANKSVYYLDKVDSLSRVVSGSLSLSIEGSQASISEDKYSINYNSGKIEFSEKPSSNEDISSSDKITASYNPSGYYQGMEPIDVGGGSIYLDGDGYTIRSLYISRKSSDNVGLFTDIGNSDIKNLNIRSSEIRGNSNVGVIAGKSSSSDINNVTIISSLVKANNNAGLIIGNSQGSIIEDSRVVNNGRSSYVSADENAGGLVGYSGSTAGRSTVISKSSVYKNTLVDANSRAGGISGRLVDGSEIEYAAFRGSIESNNYSGGLIGELSENSYVTEAYVSSDIPDKETLGSVTGRSFGTYDGVYWDKQVTSNSNSVGAGNKNPSSINWLITNQMKNDSPNSMLKFDFNSIWSDVDGEYPRLFTTSETKGEYDLTVNVTNSTGTKDITDGVVEFNTIKVLNGENSVTFNNVTEGEYELSVTSNADGGYVPNKQTIDLESDKFVEVRLQKPSNVKTKVIMTDLSNNIIPSGDVEIDGTSNSGNPAVFNNIQTSEYDITMDNINGYESKTKNDYLIDKYRPDVIDISLKMDGTSYKIDSISDPSTIGQYANINSELKNEVAVNPTASNPELNFYQGQRYRFDLSKTSNSSEFEITNDGGGVLLSKQNEASQNDNPDVNLETTGDKFEFTATDEIARNVGEYRQNSSSSAGENINRILLSDTMDIAVEQFRFRELHDFTVKTEPLVKESEIRLIKNGSTYQTRTGERVNFVDIPEGTYQITAAVDSYEEEYLSDVSISDGATYNIGLQPESSSGNVEILLSGDPSKKSRIGDDKIIFESTTDDVNITKQLVNGKDTYDIELEEGNYNVRYKSDEFLNSSLETKQITVTKGSDNKVELSLKNMETFTINTVSSESGSPTPVGIQYVSISDDEGAFDKSIDNFIADGSTPSSIDIDSDYQLPEGDYNIEVISKDTTPKTATYTSGSGTIEIDIASNIKDQIVVNITESGGSIDNTVEDIKIPSKLQSEISQSDVYDSSSNTLTLYKGVEYKFSHGDSNGFGEHGGAAVIDNNNNVYIEADQSGNLVKPLGIKSQIGSWGDDSYWNREQVLIGASVSPYDGSYSEMVFTPTDAFESAGTISELQIGSQSGGPTQDDNHGSESPFKVFNLEIDTIN